jgi:hypothetical protein
MFRYTLPTDHEAPKGALVNRAKTIPLTRQLLEDSYRRRDSLLDLVSILRHLTCIPGKTSRPRDRRPHAFHLLDLSHLRLLPRLQLPHKAHVATLEDQGGTALRGEAGARTGAWLTPTLDPPIQLAKHGCEAAERSVEGGELLAQSMNIPDHLISLTLGHVAS